MDRTPFPTRDAFRHAQPIPTRWMDNDCYNHVNNVIYYSWFDTVVNSYLIGRSLLDPEAGGTIGLVVESGCRYNRPVSFPETVEAMLRVGNLGRSSVRYEIGLFTDGHDEAAALGHFVHVYVDRESRRPMPLPDAWRTQLSALIV